MQTKLTFERLLFFRCWYFPSSTQFASSVARGAAPCWGTFCLSQWGELGNGRPYPHHNLVRKYNNVDEGDDHDDESDDGDGDGDKDDDDIYRIGDQWDLLCNPSERKQISTLGDQLTIPLQDWQTVRNISSQWWFYDAFSPISSFLSMSPRPSWGVSFSEDPPTLMMTIHM